MTLDSFVRDMQGKLDGDPNDAETWFWLGKHLRDTNREYEGAERAFRIAIELNPEYISAWQELAFLLEFKHKKKQAGEVWRKIGMIYLKKRDIQKASTAFHNAVTCYRKDAESLHMKGVLARDYGNRDSAVKSLKRSLKIQPENAQAWLDLGITLYQLKNLSEAKEALRKGLEHDEIPEAWMYLGLVLADQEKTEESINAVRKGIRIETHPRDCLWFFVGIIEFRAGDKKRAHKAFSKAMGTTYIPNTKYIDFKTRGLRVKLGKVTSLSQDDPETWIKLGGLFEDQRLEKEAELCYRQAARVDPECLDAWILIYDITRSKRDADEALHEARMIDMRDPDVLIRDAEDFYEFGMKAEAIQCLREAWRKGVNDEYVDGRIAEIQHELDEIYREGYDGYYDSGYSDEW
jgi:tetratricopeptide (TPR) repeat protein